MFQKKKAFGKFTPGKVMGAPKLGIHVIGKALTDNVLTQGIGKVAHSLDTQSKRLTQKLKITDSRGAVEGKTFFMRKVKQVHTQTTLEDQQDKPETVQALLETALQQSSFLFRDMDDFQRQDLIAAFEKVEIKKQQVIPEDYFYILYKGQIEMVDGDGETTIRSSQENEDEDGILVSFGEHAMYQQSMEFTHNDVVHARSDCVLYRLHPTHFYTIMEQEKIADSETLALFKTIPVLKDLDRNTLQQLLNAMTPCKFKKGEIIFTKGDQVKTFLIFTKGKAQGTDIEVGGSVYQDISVGPNEEIKSLGWHSILQNEPVLGNVKALTNCKALAIDAQEFQQLMGNYQDLIQRSIDIKRLDNIAIFKDSHLEQDQIVGLLDVMTTKTFMWGGNFWKEGDSIDAALCFVKKGSVTIKSKSAQTSKTIEVGGYFGDDLLLADQNKTVAENTRALTESKYTVQVSRDCVLSILALEDCRKIVNTSLLGLGKSTKICALDQTIQVKDLKRHVMLGAGSFGQVWLASTGADSKKQNKRIFALKVQSKHQLIESHQAEGVVGERNIMASLKSPFIIRLYSTFQDQARVYMLTSLLQGGELEAVIGDGLDEPTSKFYAAGILEGLTYMHRKHIIHRDLKPENVLIGANGYPVLIDLGFGKSRLIACVSFLLHHAYSTKAHSLTQIEFFRLYLLLCLYYLYSQICSRENVHILWYTHVYCSRSYQLERSQQGC